jgi:hypothetical protein
LNSFARIRDRLSLRIAAPADRRIQLGELARQRFERGVGDLPNHAQRMFRPNPLLKIYVTEKVAANTVVVTHGHPRSPPQGITMRKFGNPFSAAC